jgi:non-ribosomal peptide synthetase component F
LDDRATRAAVRQQEEFWSGEFEGEIPRLNLPLDYERPVVRSFEGDSLSFQIDKKEAEGLKELAAKEDATLFMVLLAVYNVLVSKVSGQEDIVVGVGAAGRRYEELQPIIGMFVNTLPLRSYPGKKKSFRTFLEEVREKALMAFENQDFQFEDLVEKVVPRREQNRNPLFDIAFVLQNLHVNSPDIPRVESIGLKVSPFGCPSRISRFDISFFCSEAGEGLLFNVEYCTGLFKKQTIERFILYYKEIVSGVLENNDIKLGDISISHNLLRAKPENPGMELEF